MVGGAKEAVAMTTMSMAMTKALSREQKAALLASTIRRPAISEAEALRRVDALMQREHVSGHDAAHRALRTEDMVIPLAFMSEWERDYRSAVAQVGEEL